MKRLEELAKKVDIALADDDWCEIEDIIIEAMRHLPHLVEDRSTAWDANAIKDLCQDIGDKVNNKWGVRELKNMRLSVEAELGEYAARILDTFWFIYGAQTWFQ